MEIRLAPSIGARARVQVGKQKWLVEYRNRLSLPIFLNQEIVRDNVSFVGAGNIRVIDRAQDAILKCNNSISDSDLGLWLESGGIECFCKLEELKGEMQEINVGQLAELNGFSLQAGELKVAIRTQ